MISGPPDSYFDPPELGHREGCACPECHAWHCEEATVEENAEWFVQCCIDQIEEWAEAGEYCRKHKNYHRGDGHEGCDNGS